MKKANNSTKAPIMMQQSIKVFNADGTLKKDYGVVNYWHQNIIKRILFKIKNFFRGLK